MFPQRKVSFSLCFILIPISNIILGGETPICRSDRVYAKMKERYPEFVKKLEEGKVRYERFLASKASTDANDKYQKSWQDIFETEDKAEAEKRARETGHEKIEWGENDEMKLTSNAFEATRVDKRINKGTWFNSAVLLHPPVYGIELGQALWKVTYEDGTDVDSQGLLDAHSVMKEESVAYKWEHGDVLFIDNFITMHSSNSFVPPRRLLAAMPK